MPGFEIKESPCARCGKDKLGHTPCTAFFKWAVLCWAKLQRGYLKKPMPNAEELFQRALEMERAGRKRGL